MGVNMEPKKGGSLRRSLMRQPFDWRRDWHIAIVVLLIPFVIAFSVWQMGYLVWAAIEWVWQAIS